MFYITQSHLNFILHWHSAYRKLANPIGSMIMSTYLTFVCNNNSLGNIHIRFVLEDIQTGNHVGIGDSIHNLSLVKAFCDRYLPVRIYHFSYEDILYSTHTVKPSLLAFLTHLFQYFVLDPLDIVRQVPAQKSLNNNQGKVSASFLNVSLGCCFGYVDLASFTHSPSTTLFCYYVNYKVNVQTL